MSIELFKRRRFLQFLGLSALGLGAANTVQQLTARSSISTPSNPKSTQIAAQPQSPKTQRLPEFQGITTWLNSEPLTLAKLQNQVVLVQIWTFACINCQRTLPYITRWQQTYASKGLQVIGIHTPEFAFERDLGNVKQALKQRGIIYPIAIDNDFKMWNAYQNEYWPHLFLADRQGIVQYDHIGEGAYDKTEQTIRQLLG